MCFWGYCHMTGERERVGGWKVVIHPQVSCFIESVGILSRLQRGERACWATDKHHKHTIKKHRRWKICLWEIKIMIQMFVNKTKLPLPYTGKTHKQLQEPKTKYSKLIFHQILQRLPSPVFLTERMCQQIPPHCPRCCCERNKKQKPPYLVGTSHY